ncbi:hypothetical protein CDD83_3910 [Cordyceps sp. RAO-2017]|nr:hypothetical protein CDD83_3910 [Cordyceps sp. RAO-2017]
MEDTIRGAGLYRAHRALAALADDQERLDRARRRFSESPPSYRSHQSHNSTLSRSLTPPSEERMAIAVKEREFQVYRERSAATPCDQFDDQCQEEYGRMMEASR